MAVIKTFGTHLKKGDGASSESFANVAQSRTYAYSSATKMIDTTTNDTSGAFSSHTPGIIDPGTLNCGFVIDPADETLTMGSGGLKHDYYNRTEHNYQLVYPDGYGMAFAAVIADWKETSNFDGVLEGTVTFKLTGPITEVTGS